MLDSIDTCICDDACCHNKEMDTEDADEDKLKDSREPVAGSSVQKKIKKPISCCPLPPITSCQLGVNNSLLYSGSKFGGFQKSKGNSYEVEVILQVNSTLGKIYYFDCIFSLYFCRMLMKLIHTYVVI